MVWNWHFQGDTIIFEILKYRDEVDFMVVEFKVRRSS